MTCSYLITIIVVGLVATTASSQKRTIHMVNRCQFDIWINPESNDNVPPLAEGIQKISPGDDFNYTIPDIGWFGRFYPKQGCNKDGEACQVGQFMHPCPSEGCQPPADMKVGFVLHGVNKSEQSWYDVSLIDGYSIPAEIVPSQEVGSCTKTRCAVSLDSCPMNEHHVGDLRVSKNDLTVQCLAPCQKWNYPQPFGLGRDENKEEGHWLCCPDPVSPEECRKHLIADTDYVKMVHRDCPSAFAYAYDDNAGIHNCPSDISYTINWCE